MGMVGADNILHRPTPKMSIVIDSKTSICYRYFSFHLSGSISQIILPDKKPEYIFKLKEIKNMSLIEYMYDINNISNIETTIYEEGFVEKANEITDKLNCFNFEYIKSLKVDLKNEYQMIYFRKSSYPSDAFLIRMNCRKSIILYRNKNETELLWKHEGNGINAELAIYDNDRVFISQKGNLVPLTLKNDLFSRSMFSKIIAEILDYYSMKNSIYKDFKRCLELNICCLLPLTIEEIGVYHNLQELFHNKYPKTEKLNYNFNKGDINLSYLAVKAMSKVDNDCVGILFQYCADKAKQGCGQSYFGYNPFGRFNDNVKILLGKLLSDRVSVSAKNTIIDDYINMCYQTKTKIRLKYTSIKKIEEAHNALVTKSLKKEQRSAKNIVSTNTRYNNLRKLLPKKFEWLMTQERLALESEMQGNCVVSYANKVKKDKCQIYSYVDSQGLRHTIEFNISRNKYHCVQLLSKYNEDPSEEALQFVAKLLDSPENTIK